MKRKKINVIYIGVMLVQLMNDLKLYYLGRCLIIFLEWWVEINQYYKLLSNTNNIIITHIMHSLI